MSIHTVRCHLRNMRGKTHSKNTLHLLWKCRGGTALPEHIFLTKREHTLISLLVNGLTTAEAAKALGIRANTVRTHRKNILAKFLANSLREVVSKVLDGNEIISHLYPLTQRLSGRR